MSSKKAKPSVSAADRPSPPPGAPADPASDERLLNTREVMEFLNLSRTKVWDLVNNQGLPAFKIGGDYRYLRSEVLAWLQKYRVQSGAHENDNSAGRP